MRIQMKFMLLVFLILVGTVTAVVWKTRTMIVKDKLGAIADSSMKQISPFKRLVKERLDDQKSKLVQFASLRASAGTSRVRLPEGFEAIALMQLAPAGQQWTPTWVERSASMKADLPAAFEQTLLKSFPYSRVKDYDELWARVSDRQGLPLYALLFPVEIQSIQATAAAPKDGGLPESVDYKAPTDGAQRAVLVAMTSADLLAGVTEDYIGSTSNVYLIDDKGYVASHVNKSYLGALFTEDPLVAEIVNTKKTVASGNYEDLESRAVLGHFEMIRGTNLYAVISTPLLATQEAVNSQVLTSLMIALAFTAAGLLLTYLFVGRAVVEPISSAIDSIRAINRGEAFNVAPARANDEIGSLMRLLADSSPAALASKVHFGQTATGVGAVPAAAAKDEGDTNSSSKVSGASMATDRLAQERRAAYDSVNEGFSGAVKEPLLAILGHAQLIKSKTIEDEVRTHAESIEREARRANDVIERLRGWSGTDRPVAEGLEPLDLKQVIEDVLESRGEELRAEGIYVAKELHRVPKVRGSVEQMKVAFANIVDNAREAMVSRPKKHLRVQLDFLNDTLYLVVNDTGVGMSRDVKDRAFDPFFKGFESPGRMGLGLSVVSSTANQIGGTCEIESSLGEGSTVTLKLPVAIEEKQLFRLSENNAQSATPPGADSEATARPTPPPLENRPVTQPVSAPPVVLTPPPLPTHWPLQAAETRPPISATPSARPAGASVRDAGPASVLNADSNPSLLTTIFDGPDDEDDGEAFRALNLQPAGGMAAGACANSAGQAPSGDLDLGAGASAQPSARGPDGFRVTIRRPKARS